MKNIIRECLACLIYIERICCFAVFLFFELLTLWLISWIFQHRQKSWPAAFFYSYLFFIVVRMIADDNCCK